MTNLKIFGVSALILTAIVGGIYMEVGFWNECRQTGSFFYCMRILGR